MNLKKKTMTLFVVKEDGNVVFATTSEKKAKEFVKRYGGTLELWNEK